MFTISEALAVTIMIVNLFLLVAVVMFAINMYKMLRKLFKEVKNRAKGILEDEKSLVDELEEENSQL